MLEIVKNYNSVYIICHVSPDGDCLGSAFGLKELIKDNYGVDAIVVSQYSNSLSFVGEVTLPGTVDFKDSLVISVDTGNKERVADQNYKEASYVLRIDHHLFVDPFGDTNYVKDTYPSCCEIIAEYAFENNLIVSKKAAEALYTGMTTDTGRFYYDGVTESTFATAAKLVATGIKITDIYEKIYEESFEFLKFKAYLYTNIKETANGVIYLYITKEIAEEFNLNEEEVASTVSIMSGIKDRPIWVLFYEKEGLIRARIRSNRYAINEVAANYKGGGHKFASGATVYNVEEMNSLLKELDNLK